MARHEALPPATGPQAQVEGHTGPGRGHEKLCTVWPRWLCGTLTGEGGPHADVVPRVPTKRPDKTAQRGRPQNPSLPSQCRVPVRLGQ